MDHNPYRSNVIKQHFAFVVIEIVPDKAHYTFCVDCSDPGVNLDEINGDDRGPLGYFLRAGWVPLRESPFSAQSQSSHAYSLLVLSRDVYS